MLISVLCSSHVWFYVSLSTRFLVLGVDNFDQGQWNEKPFEDSLDTNIILIVFEENTITSKMQSFNKVFVLPESYIN